MDTGVMVVGWALSEDSFYQLFSDLTVSVCVF